MAIPTESESGSQRAPAGAPDDGDRMRRRYQVRGRVQGVGFRPFVCRLARELELAGCVGNDPQGAFIEVEGPVGAVDAFETRLNSDLPPLACIAGLHAADIERQDDRDFRIIVSSQAGAQDAEITPDVATCNDCLSELLDPDDRRFRYPFINCTNCGPRYSIIQAVPYDRCHTTMKRFRMCPDCQAEYDDPTDRRFHAQPNACPVCGPRVWLADAGGVEIAGDAIRLCADRLERGQIVAVKGIGGFHLACRADNDEAVAALRERKGREAKPLAIMAASLEQAASLAQIDEISEAELTGPARPIVLMPRRKTATVSSHVAPNNDSFGIMLPYTPLHHLLLAEVTGPLIMTSANPTDEPLCCDNIEALARLGEIADAFLLHDRDIQRRVDDSVVKAAGGAPGSRPVVVPIRRARGYAPAPIRIAGESPEPILATGGELKSAVCLLSGSEAVLSEHLGELTNPAAYRNFVETIEQFKRLLKADPHVVAFDMHPDYAATRYARKLDLAPVPVQHHHAHVVSCMAEVGISGRVIGVACDGTGYGTDGAIWGCEVLACDEADFARAGHLGYFPLIGGDAAARDTWRPAIGLLAEAFGSAWRDEAGFALSRLDEQAVGVAERRLTSVKQTQRSSSLGRLFDAVAFLIGVCDRNRYEAEAAITLEALARTSSRTEPLAWAIEKPQDIGRPLILDARPMIRDLVAGARAGRSARELAWAFHETMALMLADAVGRVVEATGLTRVVLSGGCFANGLLIDRLGSLLRSAGHDVFQHRQVPTGDGGIALGQAVVAAERLRRQQGCA